MTGAAPASDYLRLKRLFEAACDLGDPQAQRERLDALGASEADRERVLALLAAPEVTRIGAPVAGMLASVSQASELGPGDSVGPWRLIAPLGAGGMGRVFEAERADGLYRQRVAIKLLRGLHGPAALERLERERRILATLEHPNIARLIDGGSTPGGLPYLVMEHVSGLPIDRWCRASPRRLAEVLGLVQQVGAALGAAHQQLVLHCDIKPANVLVTEQGRAMLVDFGIAQLEGENTTDLVAAMTPSFASPEQQAGGVLTVASDVFGLGRLLQALLPLALDAADRRHEWQAVVASATAAEPAHRYHGVPALLEDLRRLLAHEPLQALPSHPVYRLRKALRRRWAWALAGAGALAAASAFTLGLTAERDRARLAEQRSALEAGTTRQVSEFIVGLFRDADPRQAGRPDLPAHELLRRGRARAGSDLAGQPAQQAAVERVLAEAFENLGQVDEADALYEHVATLQASPQVQQPLAAAESLARLATLRANVFRFAAAEAPARRSLQERLARLPDDALEVADARNTLGMVLARVYKLDEAQQLLEQALAVRRQRLDPQGLEVAITINNLGLLHQSAERWAQSEAMYRQALALKRRALPAQHLSVVNSTENLAHVLSLQQRLAEAEPLWLEVLDARRRLHGARSWQLSNTLNSLAGLLHDQGQPLQAVPRYREALHADPSADDSSSRAVTLNNLALALEDIGQAPQAEAAWRRSLALRIAQSGADDPGVTRVQHNLARFALRQGRLADARGWAEQSLATRQHKQGEGHSDTAMARLMLAEVLLRQGDTPAAAALSEPVLQDLDRLPAPRRAVAARLAAMRAQAEGSAEQARARWRQAWQLALQHLPAAHSVRLHIGLDHAQFLHEAGQRGAALGLLASL